MRDSVFHPYDVLDIKKIEIVRSDILDYEIVRIYEYYNEYEIKCDSGVEWIYNNIFNDIYNKDYVYKPKVILIDIKVKVITHVLEV